MRREDVKSKSKMTWLYFFILILCHLKIGCSQFADCPPKEVISPCRCVKSFTRPEIQCSGKSGIDLKKEFERISRDTRANQKNFYKLEIVNWPFKEIESHLTGNLTFNQVDIRKCANLSRIHWLAFGNYAEKIETFRLQQLPNYSNGPSPYNIFEMLNSFVNVKLIDIYSTNITQLPREAFKPLLNLKYLNLFSIGSNPSHPRLSIADRAFYNLDNLTRLLLSGQQINYLPSNAFEFRRESKKTLEVILSNNNLNSFSFESGSFSNINRPVNVSFSNNQITFLDRSVFQPFLDDTRNKNHISLDYNPLNCSNCRNAWLKKGQDKYKNRVVDAKCERISKKTIFQHNFTHCPEDDLNVCRTRPELFSPCICQSNSDTDQVVTCGGKTDVNLKEVFRKISSQTRGKQKHFRKLVIKNSHSSIIAADTTKDLTFDEIEISAENVTRIHSDAFSETVKRVKKLTVTEETSNLKSGPKPYNTFDLINSFVNVIEVHFLVPKVDQIPSNGFKKLVKLQTLQFGRVFLQSPKRLSIANDAFHNLDNLTRLSLKLNRINSIARKALNFDRPSSRQLNVSLANNHLNQLSFASGSLNGFKRPTAIDLHYNYISYLDQNVFQPFLDLDFRNQIVDLSFNPINCSDCQNYWLIQGKDKYAGRVKKAFCGGTEKDVIFDKSWDHCK